MCRVESVIQKKVDSACELHDPQRRLAREVRSEVYLYILVRYETLAWQRSNDVSPEPHASPPPTECGLRHHCTTNNRRGQRGLTYHAPVCWF